jgi:cytoskeletal protein CcmA (bactofilin family)
LAIGGTLARALPAKNPFIAEQIRLQAPILEIDSQVPQGGTDRRLMGVQQSRRPAWRNSQMALSGFGRGKDENFPKASPPPSPATSAGPGNLTAFIDQGSEFEGKLSFKDTVRIDGRFSGEISSENTLIVGESGEIEATISSTNVVVSGTVIGDIKATRQIILHKTAQVEGNLETPSFVVEEGAVFNGHLSMGRGNAKGNAPLKAIKGGDTEGAQSDGQPKKGSNGGS